MEGPGRGGTPWERRWGVPGGTAGAKAQRVLRATPPGVGRGLGAPVGGSPRPRRRRRKAGDDGLAGSPLLGVFLANSWLTPRRLGRERIPQPRQPPGAGAAGRDHGSARLGRGHGRPARGTGRRGHGHPPLPPDSSPSPACAHGVTSPAVPGPRPAAGTDGRTDAGQAGRCLVAEPGTRRGPGRGCPRSARDRTRPVFPCSQRAMRHPRTPRLCSFCFPLRLFIGNF